MMYFGVEKHIAIFPINIPVRNSGTQLSKKDSVHRYLLQIYTIVNML